MQWIFTDQMSNSREYVNPIDKRSIAFVLSSRFVVTKNMERKRIFESNIVQFVKL